MTARGEGLVCWLRASFQCVGLYSAALSADPKGHMTRRIPRLASSFKNTVATVPHAVSRSAVHAPHTPISLNECPARGRTYQTKLQHPPNLISRSCLEGATPLVGTRYPLGSDHKTDHEHAVAIFVEDPPPPHRRKQSYRLFRESPLSDVTDTSQNDKSRTLMI